MTYYIQEPPLPIFDKDHSSHDNGNGKGHAAPIDSTIGTSILMMLAVLLVILVSKKKVLF